MSVIHGLFCWNIYDAHPGTFSRTMELPMWAAGNQQTEQWMLAGYCYKGCTSQRCELALQSSMLPAPAGPRPQCAPSSCCLGQEMLGPWCSLYALLASPAQSTLPFWVCFVWLDRVIGFKVNCKTIHLWSVKLFYVKAMLHEQSLAVWCDVRQHNVRDGGVLLSQMLSWANTAQRGQMKVVVQQRHLYSVFLTSVRITLLFWGRFTCPFRTIAQDASWARVASLRKDAPESLFLFKQEKTYTKTCTKSCFGKWGSPVNLSLIRQTHNVLNGLVLAYFVTRLKKRVRSCSKKLSSWKYFISCFSFNIVSPVPGLITVMVVGEIEGKLGFL